MASRNYRDLAAWQKAMDLVAAVYGATKAFPRDELYGLTNQMRRAAVSIPSNVAEGQGRGGSVEFVRFLRISHGSLRELETQILISRRLAYMDDATAGRLLDNAAEVGRIINGLIRAKSSGAVPDE